MAKWPEHGGGKGGKEYKREMEGDTILERAYEKKRKFKHTALGRGNKRKI